MILVAGATGSLGGHVIPLLIERGLPLRLLVRDAEKSAVLETNLIEVMEGDVRSLPALKRAMSGVGTVISAISAFGRGAGSIRTVDWEGNRNLIRAAEAAGVEQFILVSVQGVARDHPIELFRMKYLAEQELMASKLSWTILRSTPNVETWATILGQPLLEKGKTMVFGRGQNPINFVSARDVARFVVLAVVDPALRGEVIEVGGPQNLTVSQFLRIFEAQTGASGTESHVPRVALRVASRLLQPIKPMLAQQIRAAYVMDTTDMTFDPSETVRLYPALVPTPLAEVLAQDYPRGPNATA